MGMYTRLTFWADISKDSPAVPIVKSLIEGGPLDRSGVPDHPFFSLPHATSVLCCSSYYHRTGKTLFVFDEIANAWWLNVDSSLKNYRDEINQFLDWLAPHDVGDEEFRGFYLYEEDEQPTLIYRCDGRYAFGEAKVSDAEGH